MGELPTLFILKRWELQKKYESIKSELEAWQTLTAEKQPLEKHYRQVRRLSQELTGMINVVQAELMKLQQWSDQISFPNQIRKVEVLILAIHRTWHYFRQKLAARQGPPFGQLLEALDEFVWACYHPAFIYTGSVPEPPLTFFSGDWSPAASSRNEQLPLEQTDDQDSERYMRDKQLTGKLLKMLVIPVISMPWFQTTFLPEALLLAHETAHLLDYDLKLTSNIQRNLQAAGIEGRRLAECWLPWGAEVFADLYAVLHLGPAFVGALSLFLAAQRQTVLHTTDSNNQYPPYHLRMLIAFTALKNIEEGAFKTEAASLEKNWKEAYGVLDQHNNYEIGDYALSICAQDIEKVVAALLDGPFDVLKGQSFKAVKGIPWTRQEQNAALLVRNSLLHKREALQSTRARILLVGAQLAFQMKPEALINKGSFLQKTQDDLIRRIVESRRPGVRGGMGPAIIQPPPRSLDRQSDETDQAKGRDLAQAILAGFEKQYATSGASTED